MSLENTRQELRAAGQSLEKVQQGLTAAQGKYEKVASNLSEMLIYLQVTLPPEIQGIAQTYETATTSLRSALEVFTSKVLPNLEAAGIDGSGPQAQAIVDEVRALGEGELKGATEWVMNHLFRDEVFAMAEERLGIFAGQIEAYHNNVETHLLRDESPLTLMIANTETVRSAFAEYNDKLGKQG